MAYYNWENKEKLIEDLKASASISNFLDNQGLVASSGNYDTFKKWMKKHEINKDDYLTEPLVKEKKPKKEVKKLTLEEIFIENSDASRDIVRKAIIKNNLIQYKCSGCGNCGSWNGLDLSLQLEHKNGDSTDNRILNLEFLCPNCHTQTKTYGSKNKHNRIFEKRIKDLGIYNNKTLGYHDLMELAEKWQGSTEAVKSWIRLHNIKIQENGIEIKIEEYIPNHSILSTEIINERKTDLISIILDENWKEFLSKKWNISIDGVRKWIKENDYNFFKNNYKLSPTKKKNIYLEDRKNEIAKLLAKCKSNNQFDINLFLPFFSDSKASCISYLKSSFANEYLYFHPLPKCLDCESKNTQRFGWVKLKKGNTQRYKCLDCSKHFY
jgi:5-methylcytosine-specific restriction endonuclease McrA